MAGGSPGRARGAGGGRGLFAGWGQGSGRWGAEWGPPEKPMISMEELKGALSSVEVAGFGGGSGGEALGAAGGPPVRAPGPASGGGVSALPDAEVLWDRGPSGFRGSFGPRLQGGVEKLPKIGSVLDVEPSPDMGLLWDLPAASAAAPASAGACGVPRAAVVPKPAAAPSRSLLIRNVSQTVSDGELHQLLQQFGDLRSLYSRCKHRGFVMATFFDIRAAQYSLESLEGEILAGLPLSVHFSIPMEGKHDKGLNNGTLVVFNLDSSVSAATLKGIFASYGAVKEIRETPNKRHHRFVEFYDVRHSVAALHGLNRTEIEGKRVKIESSRPGGARCALGQQLQRTLEGEEMKPPITESELVRSVTEGVHGAASLLIQPPAPSGRGGGASCANAAAPAPVPQGALSGQGGVALGGGDLPGGSDPASPATTALVGHLASGGPRSKAAEGHKSGAPGSNSREPGEFHLNPVEILSGKDVRTTLMIKNIPNKYTEKMILQQIDECCKDGYDFFYLPIDFRNKCNVGYAFMNMKTTEDILPLYAHLNNKKWARFKSEKVCVLTYGRIQGFSALISHFQRVSLRHEDKRRRPLIFA